MTLGIQGNPEIGQGHLGTIAEQQIHDRWDTIDDVELEMTMAGLPPLETPTVSEPTIDTQLYNTITNGDGKMLTLKNMQFSAWYSYCVGLQARLESRVLQHNNQLQHMRTRLQETLNANRQSTKRLTKEDVERQAQLDPSYITIMVEHQKTMQSLNHVEARVKLHSAGQKLTSRTVEIRRQDLESNMDGGRGYRRTPEGM
jgi:hypothetical protein